MVIVRHCISPGYWSAITGPSSHRPGLNNLNWNPPGGFFPIALKPETMPCFDHRQQPKGGDLMLSENKALSLAAVLKLLASEQPRGHA
jgi:hypothetical protein